MIDPKIVCHACQGTGKSHPPGLAEEITDCPVCEGTGIRKPVVVVPLLEDIERAKAAKK